MKNVKATLTIILTISLFVSGCSTAHNSTSTSSQTQASNISSDSNKNNKSEEPSDIQDHTSSHVLEKNQSDASKPSDEAAQAASASPALFPIYNIVGTSIKLSQKEVNSMVKWRESVVALASNNRNSLYINGFTKDKLVALTFDDGPDGKNTPRILDILKENNIKGSFFFIGNKVKIYSSVVKRAAAEGSLVLSHSYTHPELTKKSEADIDKEILNTENTINEVIGKKPAIIRPPYGDVDARVLKELTKNNLKAVLWSIDTLDWSQKEKSNIVKNAAANIRPGDIILMHSNEDKGVTVEALPELIKELKDKGFKFVDLSELLNVKAYK